MKIAPTSPVTAQMTMSQGAPRPMRAGLTTKKNGTRKATMPSFMPTKENAASFPPEMLAAMTQPVQVGGVTEARVAQ